MTKNTVPLCFPAASAASLSPVYTVIACVFGVAAVALAVVVTIWFRLHYRNGKSGKR